MKEILFLLPNYPSYREDFIKSVMEKSQSKNYKLYVVAGTNVMDKIVQDGSSRSEVLRQRTLSTKFLGFNVGWQKGLIRHYMKVKPAGIVLMFHTGKVNYWLLLIIHFLRGGKYIIWGSGYRRIDLSSSRLKIKHAIKEYFEFRSSAYITYSQYFKNILVDLGYPINNIYVAQNTIKIEQNLDVNHRNPRKFIFLFVGALVRQKNIDTLLKALYLLKKSNNRPFEAHIVGDGDERPNLEMLTERLGLSENVTFFGALYGEALRIRFVSSSLFVLPGTGGLAVNEAMSYALPVVAAPGDGTVYDLVETHVNGYLLDNYVPAEDLSLVLNDFLNLSNSNIRKQGEKSREIITMVGRLPHMVDPFVSAMDSVF